MAGLRWTALLATLVVGAGCSLLFPTPSPAPFGRASWALDPAFPDPVPETTELHILVWERACSGGVQIVGRMAPPVIEYAAATLTVTMRVRPLTGFQTCPLGPGTPALVHLAEPLGERTLLDGDGDPPAEPTAPF